MKLLFFRSQAKLLQMWPSLRVLLNTLLGFSRCLVSFQTAASLVSQLIKGRIYNHNIHFTVYNITSSSFSASADFEDRVMPYLEVLSQFRESVRAVARKEKAYTILKECDRLRDELLPEVGVRLEDKADRTVLKLVDRETLLREKKKK